VDYPDDRTVVFRLTGPNSAFPAYLTSQVGYVVGEAMVRAQGAGNPIGTGPFTYSDWAQNDHFTAVRNPHYWRAGLPYLDQVTFRPIPDTTQRESALKTGAVDMILSLDATTVRDFTGQSGYQMVDSRTGVIGQPTMGFLMVNTAVAPTRDLGVRQALAKGLDQAQLQKLFGAGFSQPVNGMFLPGSPYYNSTGYPSFDQAGARSLVSAYKVSHGTPSVQISTVATPFLTQVTEVVQQMWQSVGFAVSIKDIQQADLISAAVMGEFQVATWAQFGAIDPDLNYLWLSSTTVAPVGSVGLNFPRNSDAQLQAALALGRSSTDRVTRQEAYRTVNDRLAHDLPYLWTGQTLCSVVAEPRVHNVGRLTLPNGATAYGFNEGVVYPTETWLGG
ncbi:MAG: ABC transporter substrate-binding protein, partial [Acidimicrobiales bacterium]